MERHGSNKVKLVYTVRHAEGTHNVDREYNNLAHLDARLTDKGRDQCRKLRDELQQQLSNPYHGIDQPTKDSQDGKGIDHRQGLHHLHPKNHRSDICVVTSSMSRCVETTLLSLNHLIAPPHKVGQEQVMTTTTSHKSSSSVPFVAHESLRETVNYHCDRRRPLSEIGRDFPQVDFSYCKHDEDILWSNLLALDRYRQEHDEGGHLESAELHRVARRGRQAMEFLQSLPHSKIVVCTHSAFLRCLLSWGHPGGVPFMVDQQLDQNGHCNRQEKILEYSCVLQEMVEKEKGLNEQGGCVESFELYMRHDYANAELRSFCVVTKEATE